MLIKSTRQCLEYLYCMQSMSITFAGVGINVSSNNLVYKLSITGHCLLLVGPLFLKLQLRFCNGPVLGCLSGRFLKATQLERLRLFFYWA